MINYKKYNSHLPDVALPPHLPRSIKLNLNKTICFLPLALSDFSSHFKPLSLIQSQKLVRLSPDISSRHKFCLNQQATAQKLDKSTQSPFKIKLCLSQQIDITIDRHPQIKQISKKNLGSIVDLVQLGRGEMKESEGNQSCIWKIRADQSKSQVNQNNLSQSSLQKSQSSNLRVQYSQDKMKNIIEGPKQDNTIPLQSNISLKKGQPFLESEQNTKKLFQNRETISNSVYQSNKQILKIKVLDSKLPEVRNYFSPLKLQIKSSTSNNILLNSFHKISNQKSFGQEFKPIIKPQPLIQLRLREESVGQSAIGAIRSEKGSSQGKQGWRLSGQIGKTRINTSSTFRTYNLRQQSIEKSSFNIINNTFFKSSHIPLNPNPSLQVPLHHNTVHTSLPKISISHGRHQQIIKPIFQTGRSYQDKRTKNNKSTITIRPFREDKPQLLGIFQSKINRYDPIDQEQQNLFSSRRAYQDLNISSKININQNNQSLSPRSPSNHYKQNKLILLPQSKFTPLPLQYLSPNLKDAKEQSYSFIPKDRKDIWQSNIKQDSMKSQIQSRIIQKLLNQNQHLKLRVRDCNSLEDINKAIEEIKLLLNNYLVCHKNFNQEPIHTGRILLGQEERTNIISTLHQQIALLKQVLVLAQKQVQRSQIIMNQKQQQLQRLQYRLCHFEKKNHQKNYHSEHSLVAVETSQKQEQGIIRRFIEDLSCSQEDT